MVEESTRTAGDGDGLFMATLRASLASGCSADDLFRGLRPGDVRRIELPPLTMAAIVRQAFAERMPKIVADLVDYARRRTFLFEGEADDGRRYPETRPLDREELAVAAERRTIPGSRRPSDTAGDGSIALSLGQCVARIVEDCAARCLSDRSMELLFGRMDYDLDWLLYGRGHMCRDVYSPVDTPWTDPGRITCEEDRYPSFADLNRLRHATAWTLMEWNWLINNVARSNYRCRQPIQPLCVRMVTGWNIDPCQPDLPQPPLFAVRMRRFLVREFLLGRPAKEAWKQRIIEECALVRDKIYLLFGITRMAASAYRRGVTSPSSGIMRVCYYLEMVVRRWGREGFLRYLDIVDDEARGRRFEGLSDVFARGTWVFHEEGFTSRRGRPRKRREGDAAPQAGGGEGGR